MGYNLILSGLVLIIIFSTGIGHGEEERKPATGKWQTTLKKKVAVTVEDKGIISYEEGEAVARGTWSSHDQKKSIAKIKCLRQARINANSNLVEVLKRIQIDTNNDMDRLFSECDMIGRTTEGYLIKSATTKGKPVFMDDGTCEVEVKVLIKGAVLNYIAEAKSNCEEKPRYSSQETKTEVASGLHACTNVIVDARGAGVLPAIFPRFIDEKGEVIFDFLSRSGAISAGEGTVIYGKYLPVAQIGKSTSSKLIAIKAKAIGAGGPGRSDVKIGTDDAKKLRNLEKKSRSLTKCGAFIVVD